MKRPPLFLVLLTLALALLPSCTPPGGGADAKPVIYLYPEAETDVTVTLDYDGELTCVYPVMNGNSWMVTASPDGTLTDAVGQTYNYLYWEGVSRTEYDFSQGFCVPGRDTAAFLEDTLATLGLNRREANEFIVYWLPHMEGNAYNLIAFQTSSYTDHARLTADPAPDTVLRVFMAWKPLDRSVELPPQTLAAPVRTGFTLVEWGGAEISYTEFTPRRNSLVSPDCHRAGLRRTVQSAHCPPGPGVRRLLRGKALHHPAGGHPRHESHRHHLSRGPPQRV